MANLQIFPAPISRRAIRCGGFTFLEVMIALVMCTLLVSAVCSSLYTILQAEQLSMRLRTASLTLRTLECRYAVQTVERQQLGSSFEPDWILSQLEPKPTPEMAWTVLTLAADEQSPVAAPLALRIDISDWQ